MAELLHLHVNMLTRVYVEDVDFSSAKTAHIRPYCSYLKKPASPRGVFFFWEVFFFFLATRSPVLDESDQRHVKDLRSERCQS